MKILYFSFSLLFIFAGLSVEAFSQKPVDAKQNQSSYWSALFPEIPNCERVIQPITQKGDVLEQTAIYEREGYKKYKNENYFGCGSIILRFAPSARKSASESAKAPFTQKFQIKTFDAYSKSPKCGNDIWVGSIAVYFDEDKVLIVKEYVGGNSILDFAQNADYNLLRKSMYELIKRKTK